jgi:hypothetical protein
LTDEFYSSRLHSQWVYKLPLEYPRHIALCFSELEGQLRDMIDRRRLDESSGSEHSDLFSALLSGINDSDEKDPVLTTEELLGNMYIFLLAGHGVFRFVENRARTDSFLFDSFRNYGSYPRVCLHTLSFVPRASRYTIC